MEGYQKWAIHGLLLFIFVSSTGNKCSSLEPQTCDVGGDHSANWGITTAKERMSITLASAGFDLGS